MVYPERENFRFDPIVAEKLAELSKQTGLTKSEIVRKLIEKATAEQLLEKKKKRF